MTQMTLICRRCRVNAEGIREAGKPDLVRCPRCGISGELDGVKERTAQYLSSELADEVSNMFAKTAARSKSFTYTKRSRPTTAAPDFIFR